MKAKYTSIGGQAVLEGVMMRSPEDKKMAIAVRKDDGSITVSVKESANPSDKSKFYSLPIVRGVVNFIGMMVMGYHTISESAKMYGLEEEEPSKLEKWLSEKLGKSTESIVMGFAMVMAAVLAVGLFMLLPSAIAQLLKKAIDNPVLVNFLEGVTRLVIFVVYIAAVSLMKDIKRVFMYHGAEHKTISCFEAGQELTPENARKFSRFHPRCGTSFLLIVMVVSILLFTVLGWDYNLLTRFASRLALMPVVAGVSYEILKLLGKYDNLFVRVIRAPGMALQVFTTREPDDSMLEVAIEAFHAATGGRFAAEKPLRGADEAARAENDDSAGAAAL